MEASAERDFAPEVRRGPDPEVLIVVAFAEGFRAGA
jgi:hypothetical protein